MACSSRRSVAEYGSSDIRSPSSSMPTSRSRVPVIGTMSRTPRFSIQRRSLSGSTSLKSAGKSRIAFASSINAQQRVLLRQLMRGQRVRRGVALECLAAFLRAIEDVQRRRVQHRVDARAHEACDLGQRVALPDFVDQLHEHLLLLIRLAKKPAVERRLQPLPRLERRGDGADQARGSPSPSPASESARPCGSGFETIENTSSAIGSASSVRSAARANRY